MCTREAFSLGMLIDFLNLAKTEEKLELNKPCKKKEI